MFGRQAPSAAIVTAATALLASCGADDRGTSAEPDAQQPASRSHTSSAPSTTKPAGTTAERVPDNPIAKPDPADFVAVIDNPYRPMVPGSRWVYRTSADDGQSRTVTTILTRTRVVQGVRCIVVHDIERALDGELVEDTYDWYAQDLEGNVWYFGEDTTAYDDGKASKAGSWEAGIDGAQAGLIMLAEPRAGDVYQQEYYQGEAEDQGEVLAVDTRLEQVPARYGGLLQTADTTPLEPELVEHKYYARGVGLIYEETVRGGREQVVLVSLHMTR
jgi:hypothetical protein